MESNYEIYTAKLEEIQFFNTGVFFSNKEIDLGSQPELKASADKIVGLYKKISVAVLLELDNQCLDALIANVKDDLELLNNIKNNLNNLATGHGLSYLIPKIEQGIKNLKDRYNERFKFLRDIISYSNTLNDSLPEIENKAKEVLFRIDAESSRRIELFEEEFKKINNLESHLAQIVSEQVSEKQSVYFLDESKKQKKSSLTWLIFTISTAVITVLLAFCMSRIFPEPKTASASIQIATSKLLIFGTLTFLLYLFSKMYLGCKHNEVLNKHRHNALMTFRAMTDAAGTIEGREIILTQASHCMFDQQETGYIKVVPSENVKTVLDNVQRTFTRN